MKSAQLLLRYCRFFTKSLPYKYDKAQKMPGPQRFTIKVTIVLLMLISFENKLFPMLQQQGVLSNSPSPLEIPTYDGSGHITHPDVISFESPWNNYPYWMVATPYPDRNSAY